MAGLCEHGNEPSCSIRKQDIFDKLNDNLLSTNILHHGVSKLVSKISTIHFKMFKCG
jgi:hypothetical protein